MPFPLRQLNLLLSDRSFARDAKLPFLNETLSFEKVGRFYGPIQYLLFSRMVLSHQIHKWLFSLKKDILFLCGHKIRSH